MIQYGCIEKITQKLNDEYPSCSCTMMGQANVDTVELDELQLLNNLNEFEFRNNQKSIQYIVIQDV